MSTNTTTVPNTSKTATPQYLNIIRIIVGVLFIISGLLKANDPHGLSFKMQEFFEKWSITGMNDFTLTFAILIITFEILAGVAILIGYAVRLVTILLIALMAFFLFLTGYAVWYEISTGTALKCGCFGDCIPLTAWQSFWKDVILLVLTIILFIKRDYIRPLFDSKKRSIFMIGALVITLLIQFIAIRNLPFIDCLPFKKGNDLNEIKKKYADAPPKLINMSKYTLMKDGKEIVKTFKEYESDSTLWELDIVKVEEKFVGDGANMEEMIINDFNIYNANNENFTEALFQAEGYYFVWFIRELDKMDKSNLDKMIKLYQACNEDKTQSTGVIVVTSDPVDQVQKFLESENLQADIFTANATSIKTAIRSNPGLVLFQKGKILEKWTPANYPTSFTIENGTIKF